MNSKPVEKRLEKLEHRMDLVLAALGKVERFCQDDQETALMHARKSAEAICFEIYRAHTGEMPGTKSLQDYIKAFQNWNTHPRKVVSALVSIQQYCNEASHFNEGIDVNTLRPVLSSLALLVNWYFTDFLKSSMPGGLGFLGEDALSMNAGSGGEASTGLGVEFIRSSTTLCIGCIPFPPFCYGTTLGEPQQFVGFYVSLLKNLAEKEGLQLRFIHTRNEDAMPFLNERIVDMVACLLQSPERLRRYQFVGSFFQLAVGGIVREAGKPIRSIRDLRQNSDLRFAVCKGEIGSYVLAEKLQITKDIRQVYELATPNVDAVIDLVRHGTADIAITDNLTLVDYLKRFPDAGLKIVFSQAPIYTDKVGIMMRKEDIALARWLEEQFCAMQEEKIYGQLESQLLENYADAIIPV